VYVYSNRSQSQLVPRISLQPPPCLSSFSANSTASDLNVFFSLFVTTSLSRGHFKFYICNFMHKIFDDAIHRRHRQIVRRSAVFQTQPSLYGRPRFYKKIHSDWITKSFHQRLVFTYYFLVHRKYLVYFLFIAGRLSLLALPLLFLGNLSCWYMDLYFCFLPAGRVLPLILLEFFCYCDCLLTGWLTWQLARLCREVGCWLI